MTEFVPTHYYITIKDGRKIPVIVNPTPMPKKGPGHRKCTTEGGFTFTGHTIFLDNIPAKKED